MILEFLTSEMYDEFLASDLSDVLTGSEVDFLSNDFVNEPFNSNDGRGGQNSKVEKAKAQCETQLTRLWLKSEIEHCGKLGKNRCSELGQIWFDLRLVETPDERTKQ